MPWDWSALGPRLCSGRCTLNGPAPCRCQTGHWKLVELILIYVDALNCAVVHVKQKYSWFSGSFPEAKKQKYNNNKVKKVFWGQHELCHRDLAGQRVALGAAQGGHCTRLWLPFLGAVARACKSLTGEAESHLVLGGPKSWTRGPCCIPLPAMLDTWIPLFYFFHTCGTTIWVWTHFASIEFPYWTWNLCFVRLMVTVQGDEWAHNLKLVLTISAKGLGKWLTPQFGLHPNVHQLSKRGLLAWEEHSLLFLSHNLLSVWSIIYSRKKESSCNWWFLAKLDVALSKCVMNCVSWQMKTFYYYLYHPNPHLAWALYRKMTRSSTGCFSSLGHSSERWASGTSKDLVGGAHWVQGRGRVWAPLESRSFLSQRPGRPGVNHKCRSWNWKVFPGKQLFLPGHCVWSHPRVKARENPRSHVATGSLWAEGQQNPLHCL